jgi:glycerol-3-phosphate acyltransferase PlsY
MLAAVSLVVASYVLGAVPFGLLIARLNGVDIRKVGSGNIGATNVMRSVGKPWGLATFALDALKGFVPAFVFPRFAPQAHEALPIACAFAAILGHNFPVWLGFKGGKGVATSAGALVGLAPAAAGLGLAIWAAVFFAFRYVSLASLVAAVVIPVAGWWMYRAQGWILPAFLTVLAVLIIARHKANIRRLLNGTESRFTKKQEPRINADGRG